MLPRLSAALAGEKAAAIRRDLVSICVRNGAGHIAPSLSSVDLLAALYYKVMKLSRDPAWDGRDRLVFSKAHGCYGLYAILADLGYIPRRHWESFYRGSPLSGCLERNVAFGLEASCGALGHGLPQAVGIAFGARLQGKAFSVYCVVGDGELQEGSNWEALQFAVKHGLSNLSVIVDANRLQAMDFLKNILTPAGRPKDLQAKLRAFGLEVTECDGHDVARLARVLERPRRPRLPRAVVARTIKGYGVRCMENVPRFHFRLPTQRELAKGMRR